MMRHLKFLTIMAVIIATLLVFFTDTLAEAFRLTLPIMAFWIIPGYSILALLWKDATEIERAITSLLLGFGLIPLLLYYPSLFGFAIIKPAVGYFISAALLIILFAVEQRSKNETFGSHSCIQ